MAKSFMQVYYAKREEIRAGDNWELKQLLAIFENSYMFSEKEARCYRDLLTFPEFAEAIDLPLR